VASALALFRQIDEALAPDIDGPAVATSLRRAHPRSLPRTTANPAAAAR